MSYTRPQAQPQGHPVFDTNRLREGMIAEVYAINGYAEYIAGSDSEEINAVLRRILRGEKEHFGMFLVALRRYDPEQYRQYREARAVKPGKEAAPEQRRSPPCDRRLLLNNLREAVKEEAEAVILYEQHAGEACSQDVRSLFAQIAAQEKWHVELLVRLLLKYDPDRYGPLKEEP